MNGYDVCARAAQTMGKCCNAAPGSAPAGNWPGEADRGRNVYVNVSSAMLASGTDKAGPARRAGADS
jgi:hypothetical protein